MSQLSGNKLLMQFQASFLSHEIVTEANFKYFLRKVLDFLAGQFTLDYIYCGSLDGSCYIFQALKVSFRATARIENQTNKGAVQTQC